MMKNPKSQILNPKLLILSLLGFWILSFGFITGCARTVTPVVVFGKTAVVEVTLRGNADISHNKYYMLVGSSESYQIPVYPYEFIEPGQAPTDPTFNPQPYQATWYSYVILDNSAMFMRVPGPFTATQETYTHAQISTFTPPATVLRFNLPLDEVFPSGIPQRVYFNFITVDQTRYLKDQLATKSNSLLTYTNTEVVGSDDEDSGINASLDVISWRILIQ
ncbi:MAG: hypothetical protein NT099_07730 [Candidatus Saganbacteria bacterium]|nr:hypothetical protein [Candidatus Saganbacteria bacterium]